MASRTAPYHDPGVISSPTTSAPDYLMTRSEVEKEFGLSRRFLETAGRTGRGPAFIRIGRSVRYQAGDIRAWIRDSRVQPTG